MWLLKGSKICTLLNRSIVLVSQASILFNLFLKSFLLDRGPFCGATCVPSVLDDTAHGFQSQGGSPLPALFCCLRAMIPRVNLWLLGLGIKPGSLTCEVSTISLRQPSLFEPIFSLIWLFWLIFKI